MLNANATLIYKVDTLKKNKKIKKKEKRETENIYL